MPALLKDFPSEIKKAVLQKQLELKTEQKIYKASQKQALIEIVTEWLKLKPTKPS